VAAPAPAEALDQTTALKVVMKTALAHDGLARGLHEACRFARSQGLRALKAFPVRVCIVCWQGRRCQMSRAVFSSSGDVLEGAWCSLSMLDATRCSC
jgi:hypothetical protein